MHAVAGYTKEITAQLACLLFAQRRTRLIAQPTAVKMCARLHAIEQVARS